MLSYFFEKTTKLDEAIQQYYAIKYHRISLLEYFLSNDLIYVPHHNFYNTTVV